MDKQLTSVCNNYLLRTTAGLHNSGFFFFFFFKAKAVFTAGTDKSWDKARSKLGPESVPAASFTPSRLEPDYGLEREKRDLPMAPPEAPRRRAAAELPPSRRARGKPSPRQGGQHGGVSWRDGTFHVPLQASANCFIRLCWVRAISPLGQSFHADAVCIPISKLRNAPRVNLPQAGCKHMPNAVIRDSAAK